jgi:hypothetical protein
VGSATIQRRIMNYEEFEMQTAPAVVTMCTGCGCLVADTDIHDDFHKSLYSVARIATDAQSMVWNRY